MSRTAYPLKLPASVKAATTRPAKADGVSLDQFIAVAEKTAGVFNKLPEDARGHGLSVR